MQPRKWLRGGAIVVAAFSWGTGPFAQAEPDPPAGTTKAVSADEQRARSLEDQLRSDTQLKDEPVTLEVAGKHVRLTGSVATAEERQHAENLVRDTDPTLVIDNQLRAREQTPTATTRSATSERARRTGRQVVQKTNKAVDEVAEMATDGWVTSKIKAQLIGADNVHASSIEVDTIDGVVTLRGHVRSEAERQRVLQIAKTTRGVQSVVDQLERTKAR